MPRRKNTKRIDPRYFLNETTHRDLDENLQRQAQPETRAEIALTWALTQRASNWAGQELTIDHFVDLLKSPSVAEVYQRLQYPMDRKPFTADDAAEHVKRLLSPSGQGMKYSNATGAAFDVIQPDPQEGRKKSDGLVFWFSPGIKDPNKIIWHGAGKQSERSPRFKKEGEPTIRGGDPSREG